MNDLQTKVASLVASFDADSVNARNAIIEIGPTVIPIILTMTEPGAGRLQMNAVSALASFGESATTALIHVAHTADPIIRCLAVSSLGRIGGLDAIRCIESLSSDGVDIVRGAVIQGLAINHAAAADGLIRRGLNDVSPSVRVASLTASRNLLPGDTLDFALAAANDSNWSVRENAVGILSLLIDPRVVPALLAALADSSPTVVMNALDGLSLNGSTDMLARIEKLRRHRNPEVRRLAANTIETLRSRGMQ